jgi:hypothetical protein
MSEAPLPDSGPRFTLARDAATAARFSVPSCPTTQFYNLFGPDTVYGHFAQASLVVHPRAGGFFNPNQEIPGVDVQRFTVHDEPAYGYESGDVPRSVSSGADTVGPPIERTYMQWAEGDAIIQLASNTYSLASLQSFASGCTLVRP